MSLRQVTAALGLGLLATATLAACSGGAAPSNGAAPPAAVAPSPVVQGTSPAAQGTSPAAQPVSGGQSVPASRPAGSGTVAASSTECANASSTTVAKALGMTVGKLMATAEGPVTVCAYAGRYEVLVRYQAGESSSLFIQDKQLVTKLHQSVSAVDGLGDQAFFASYTVSKPASNTLAVRKADTAVFITSPASLAAERTLMAELLQKL